MRHILLFIVAAGSGVAGAQSSIALPASRSQGSPEKDAEIEAMNDALRQGRKAEERGDYRTAERFYMMAVDTDPRRYRFQRIHLAQLYDKMGRDGDAYAEYRSVVVGSPDSWSSHQEDPRILARYADLSLRFGGRSQAMAAYREAAAHSGQSDTLEPSTTILEKNPSLALLQAAAHTAAAIRHRSHGANDEELRELALALRADPDYWVGLFYRARDYDVRTGEAGRRQAIADAARVESRAKGKYRNMVRWMRATHSLPDLQGRTLEMPRLPAGIIAEPPVIP